jgi:hypothetical protein
VAPFADPVVGDGDVAVDGDETDGNEVVVSPGTPEPTALSLLVALPLVWPVGCDTVWPWTVWPWTVWPWAAVMPISIAAMMKMGFIALSCTQVHRTTPKPQKWKMKFRKGPGKEPQWQSSTPRSTTASRSCAPTDAIVTCRKSGIDAL